MWGNTEFNATGTLNDDDASGRLERIEAPTLFTCGAFDEATPAACREFAARVPNGRAEVIPDASHRDLWGSGDRALSGRKTMARSATQQLLQVCRLHAVGAHDQLHDRVA